MEGEDVEGRGLWCSWCGGQFYYVGVGLRCVGWVRVAFVLCVVLVAVDFWVFLGVGGGWGGGGGGVGCLTFQWRLACCRWAVACVRRSAGRGPGWGVVLAGCRLPVAGC